MKVQVYEGHFYPSGQEFFYYDLNDLNKRKREDGSEIAKLMLTQRMIWNLQWEVKGEIPKPMPTLADLEREIARIRGILAGVKL